jgi:hypothetical protein
MYRMATVAEINAEAARFQAQVGSDFAVSPNSYGVRIECNTCHESATHDRAYRFAQGHSHGGGFVSPRPADYRSETVNADGTKNIVLGWA